MGDCNIVQYCVPESSDVVFSILSHERDVSIKLLSGAAELSMNNRRINLAVGQEFPLPVWECLWPQLRSATACEFIFRGNHYVYYAAKSGSEWRNLFRVSQSDRSFSFILERNIQLQIFVTEVSESDVTLKCTRGVAEIFGKKLFSSDGAICLTPCSNFIVKSGTYERYSVHVKGIKRRIKVSICDETFLTCRGVVQDRILMQCMLAKKFKRIGPTVLVIGQPNSGKTSFCHWLMNKALDERMNPVYVNLDIRRNPDNFAEMISCGSVPGSISLRNIKGRSPFIPEFVHDIQKILHFGNVVFNTNTIQHYYLLIQKMGELLKLHQETSDRSYSGAVVDMCGLLGMDAVTIDCVLRSFAIDLVVVIGDRNSYEILKQSVLKTVSSHFLSAPLDIEPRKEHWEKNYLDYKIRSYFYGSILPPVFQRNLFRVELQDINIYRVVTTKTVRNSAGGRINHLSIEPVSCDPSIEYYVLAMSESTTVDEHLPLATIKCFVCFVKVDMDKNIATILAPECDKFFGGLFIMGYLKLGKDDTHVYNSNRLQ